MTPDEEPMNAAWEETVRRLLDNAKRANALNESKGTEYRIGPGLVEEALETTLAEIDHLRATVNDLNGRLAGAEAALSQRYALRREIEAALGMTSEMPSDDALREGLARITALRKRNEAATDALREIDAAIVEHDGDGARYEPSLPWLAGRVREVLREARSLPVLRTCAGCGWCDRDDEGPVCGMAEAVGTRIDDPRLPPPSWCPLRGGGR